MKEESKKEDNDKIKNEVQSIQVDISEAVSDGIYSNIAIVNFNMEEFVMDFAFLQPQIKKGKVRSRILLSPRNAKLLAELLFANIKKYESSFGPIKNTLKHSGAEGTGISFSSN
ncbi:MAG: DUF3467 domain-containing protein [bacterium]|nr:DUF3467 domain-containing protein [bacterium]